MIFKQLTGVISVIASVSTSTLPCPVVNNNNKLNDEQEGKKQTDIQFETIDCPNK
ncbi:hypothetical protein BB558_001276 [Smittium angustum]|uniref:Lipoprotein n=1 Tax=Smittium angustum TaxID=133377 RepID=A0A2U1JBV8_SMIAN|nr:hypothetical protein BB558_001276 [Smittium angustum]